MHSRMPIYYLGEREALGMSGKYVFVCLVGCKESVDTDIFLPGADDGEKKGGKSFGIFFGKKRGRQRAEFEESIKGGKKLGVSSRLLHCAKLKGFLIVHRGKNGIRGDE